MKKTYNVGIIGPGFIGRVHAYGYENLKYYYPEAPFRTRLFGVCSGREETLKKIQDDFRFSFSTTDFRALVNHPEIDMVDICTPNILHREQILEAVKAGKHIYCEKPLVSCLDDSEAVMAALKGFRQVHQLAFHNRFFPASIKARELIDSGRLGEPVSFRIAYLHSGSLEKNKAMGWKQEEGAGVSLDLGSHIIDLIYFFWGEFSEISASTRILYPERMNKNGEKVKVKVEDYFSCSAKLKNGAEGHIEASKIAAGTQDEMKYELYGTDGALRYNSMQPNFLEYYSCKEEESGFRHIPTVSRYKESTFPGPKFAVGWTRAHIHSIYNFISCVHENKKASPSFHEGHYNMKILEAARLSEKKRAWIKTG